MKIILSPAKKMIVDTDNLAPVELPVYIDKTAEVLNWMKSKSKEELKAIWKCNDKIADWSNKPSVTTNGCLAVPGTVLCSPANTEPMPVFIETISDNALIAATIDFFFIIFLL